MGLYVFVLWDRFLVQILRGNKKKLYEELEKRRNTQPNTDLRCLVIVEERILMEKPTSGDKRLNVASPAEWTDGSQHVIYDTVVSKHGVNTP